MSPIAYPDLLQERPLYTKSTTPTRKMPSSEERGRKSSGGRLMSTLRSRSRSRAAGRQNRSASAQPTEHRSSSKLADAKKRRSLSRPNIRRPKDQDDKYAMGKDKNKSKKKMDIVDLTKKITKETSRTKSRSKTSSPVKRRPSPGHTQVTPRKNWGADIINLVDQEDEILDELLNPGSSPVAKRKSSSSSGVGSPKSAMRFPDSPKHTRKNVSYSDEESSDEEEEDEELDGHDLLAQVNARMEQQRHMEEAKELRRVVEKKDAEIDQLTGQLRMAISTKCDLVIAHTELERLHEQDMTVREKYAEDMKRSNLYLMEVRAEVEKEFMNELTELSKKVQETEEWRKKDVEDKDLTIKLLEQKIYRMERNALQGSSARPDNDKVKFYKKKLGVVDQ